MAGDGSCTRCCCSFVLTSGLTALFLWLSLRTYNPTLLIQDFYLPALNISDNSTANHTIFFKLTLQNKMKDKGVSYANISLLFLYNSTLAVANYTVPSFYQGHGKTAHRKYAVDAAGMPWAAALAAASNGTVNFRVRATTKVRSKIVFWFTKSHGLVVHGDLAVDGSGENVKKKKKKKSVKLKSGVPDRGRFNWVRIRLYSLFTLFLILFL